MINEETRKQLTGRRVDYNEAFKLAVAEGAIEQAGMMLCAFESIQPEGLIKAETYALLDYLAYWEVEANFKIDSAVKRLCGTAATCLMCGKLRPNFRPENWDTDEREKARRFDGGTHTCVNCWNELAARNIWLSILTWNHLIYVLQTFPNSVFTRGKSQGHDIVRLSDQFEIQVYSAHLLDHVRRGLHPSFYIAYMNTETGWKVRSDGIEPGYPQYFEVASQDGMGKNIYVRYRQTARPTYLCSKDHWAAHPEYRAGAKLETKGL